MLASILPGLRDFRTPFATGMLWLTVMWLWFGHLIPETIPQSGPLRQIYLASSLAGVSALLAIVGFVGYFLGLALSIGIVPVNVLWGTKTLPASIERLGRFVEDKLERGKIKTPQQVSEIYGTLAIEARSGPAEPKVLSRDLVRAVMHEEDALEMRLLVADKATLYNQYDQDKSESEFRISIGPPMLLVIVTATLQTSDELLLRATIILVGLLLVSVILWRGLSLGRGAIATLLQAVATDTIKAPLLDKLDTVIGEMDSKANSSTNPI